MERLSGDQNGDDPSSVLGSACADCESNARTQSCGPLFPVEAEKATLLPSGDSAIVAFDKPIPNAPFSGGPMVKRTACFSSGGVR